MRLPFVSDSTVMLYTDLDPEECQHRIADSGWTGAAKPDRWQPTTLDLNVFRKIHGDSFQLNLRRTTRNMPPEPQLTAARRLEQGYSAMSFRGRLQPHGSGTRITGRFGFGIVTRLSVLAVIGYFALQVGSGIFRDEVVTTGEYIYVAAVMLALLAYFLGRAWLERKLSARSDAYIVEFLERFLEARGVESQPGGTPPSAAAGDPPP